ncbi:hypothetical protein MRX96_002916 [Rhipicephalus microplus]
MVFIGAAVFVPFLDTRSRRLLILLQMAASETASITVQEKGTLRLVHLLVLNTSHDASVYYVRKRRLPWMTSVLFRVLTS